MLAKEATCRIYFTCNKLKASRLHKKGSTVHKKPLLIALSKMQSSQQSNTHEIKSGMGLGGGMGYSDLLDRSVLCDPRTLGLYHTMFTCNFTTPTILDISLKYATSKQTLFFVTKELP